MSAISFFWGGRKANVKQPKGGVAGGRCFSFAFAKNSQTALPKFIVFVYVTIPFILMVSRKMVAGNVLQICDGRVFHRKSLFGELNFH